MKWCSLICKEVQYAEDAKESKVGVVHVPSIGNREERIQRYLQEVCKRLQAELPDSAFEMSEIYEKSGAKIRLFSSRNVKKFGW